MNEWTYYEENNFANSTTVPGWATTLGTNLPTY